MKIVEGRATAGPAVGWLEMLQPSAYLLMLDMAPAHPGELDGVPCAAPMWLAFLKCPDRPVLQMIAAYGNNSLL